MSSRLLSDELWNEISPFLPQPQSSPLGGRRFVDNRTVLMCILFVLKTGIAWKDLPLELGCSYRTCQRRFAEWTRAGVWEKFLRHTLDKLRAAGKLNVLDVLIDAGLVKAPLGGQKPGPILRIEAVVAASTI